MSNAMQGLKIRRQYEDRINVAVPDGLVTCMKTVLMLQYQMVNVTYEDRINISEKWVCSVTIRW